MGNKTVYCVRCKRVIGSYYQEGWDGKIEGICERCYKREIKILNLLYNTIHKCEVKREQGILVF